jgi:ADP-ribosylglycohydrolase
MTHNEIFGVVFGNALGDAMGLSTEFMNMSTVIKTYGNIDPKTFKFTDRLSDYHRSTWIPGDWTDDTDQMLCLMDSLKTNYFSKELFAERLIEWLNNGFPECGDKTGHGVGTTISIWWGDIYAKSDPIRAGIRTYIYNPLHPCNCRSNGGVMRTSIIGTLKNIDDVITNAVDICSVTHASPYCVASSVFISVLIYNIINHTKDVEELILESYNNILDCVRKYCIDFNNSIQKIELDQDDEMKNTIDRNIKEFYKPVTYEDVLVELQDSIVMRDIDDIDLEKNMGETFKPVKCACYALRNISKSDFTDTIVKILKKGGDADTNCAVAGAVIGAWLGYSKLPKKLLNEMPHRRFLYKKTKKFINNLCKSQFAKIL